MRRRKNANRIRCAQFCLSSRDDLDPLTVGVGDEVKTHRGILTNDATHLLVKLMDGVEVVYDKGNMGVLASIIIWLNLAAVPSELNFKRSLFICHKSIGP